MRNRHHDGEFHGTLCLEKRIGTVNRNWGLFIRSKGRVLPVQNGNVEESPMINLPESATEQTSVSIGELKSFP
jgi:hypothetical protein